MQRVLCLFLIFLTSACNHYTNIRQHKEFTQVFPKYSSVAIVPAYIFINQQTKNGLKTTQPNPERIDNILKTTQKQLDEKGYTVTEIYSYDETTENDDFNNSYKDSISKLYNGKESGNYDNAFSTEGNLGTIPPALVKNSHADLLLVLGYEGSEMSQEEVTKNFAKDMAWAMIGVPMDTHIKDGSAIISLVETNTGNLLWSNLGTDFENYGASLARTITKNNVMETAFEHALKDLPDKKISPPSL